jgi:dTDP-4-dehydrorhamnose reductase
MRVLLTGVTGQVGNALRASLHEFGQVIAVGREQLDLAQPQMITDALTRHRPDLIINPAAYTAVDLAEDERDLSFRVNADAPAAMAAWASQHDVPFIHFSTDYVFDGSGEVPWRESDQPAPLSVYGASKLAGEKAVINSGARHLIIRTSWVYAARGKNFFRTIAKLARERSELKIVVDQIGAPTSARIIAEGVAKILRGELGERAIFDRRRGLLHLSASGETSWHEFASAIVNGLRRRGSRIAAERIIPIATEDFPTKAQRPKNSRLDHLRLNNEFGIVMPAWRDALVQELDELAEELSTSSVGNRLAS